VLCRLGYAVCMLEYLKQEVEPEHELIVMYDIACKLRSYMQVIIINKYPFSVY